jgi:hypothetical protein
MPRYSLTVVKNEEKLDEKHSRDLASQELLDAAFEEAKNKYHATEDKQRETTMGSMGSHGLFKFATGKCQHGKKVELQYNKVEGESTCHPSFNIKL